MATIDGIHLDEPSAEKWSRVFVGELLKKTNGCLSNAKAAEFAL
jgi:hypothetical protein